MKKEAKNLTYEQAKELKFFCKSVLGIRQDFYDVQDLVFKFNDRITRLEKTCKTIEDFLGEEIKPFEKVDWEKSETTS